MAEVGVGDEVRWRGDLLDGHGSNSRVGSPNGDARWQHNVTFIYLGLVQVLERYLGYGSELSKNHRPLLGSGFAPARDDDL